MVKKIFLISVLLSFLIVGFCFAAGKELELIYPKIPGAEPPTTTKTALPDYLTYIFTLAIIISGILAFGAMVAGGVKYITSMGSPGALGDARDQIVSGFLGAIIILASYLILNSINPQLILPNQAPLIAKTSGVRIYSLAGCDEDATHPSLRINDNIPDLSKVKSPVEGQERSWGTGVDEKGVNRLPVMSIKFYGNPNDVTVKLYTSPDYKPPASERIINYETCAFADYSANSIKLDWHIPGVYLYPEVGCQGDPKIYQNSSATLPNFNDKTRSLRFIYGECSKTNPTDYNLCDQRYAAVLHEKDNFMGSCEIYDGDAASPTNCYLVSSPNGVSSVTVYLKLKLDESAVGQGVKLWEDKNYEGDSLGYYPVGDTPSLGSFNDKTTAVEIDGDYLAVLFDNDNYGGKCGVFPTSAPNLRDYPMGQCGWLGRGDCLSSLKVRARK